MYRFDIATERQNRKMTKNHVKKNTEIPSSGMELFRWRRKKRPDQEINPMNSDTKYKAKLLLVHLITKFLPSICYCSIEQQTKHKNGSGSSTSNVQSCILDAFESSQDIKVWVIVTIFNIFWLKCALKRASLQTLQGFVISFHSPQNFLKVSNACTNYLQWNILFATSTRFNSSWRRFWAIS